MLWGMQPRCATLFLLVVILALSSCAQQQPAIADYDGDNSPDSDDCGPTDASIFPGAPDSLGDEIDQNCDGTDGVDSDGDGVAVPADCDDTDSARYPGATDSWDDEGDIDENCDGLDGIDGDGDGYPADASPDSPEYDCNDQDPLVHPGATEDPETPVDDNCDGLDGDVDQDGYSVPEDCADDDSAIHPGSTEICDDIDQDCDDDLVADFSDLDGDRMPDCADDDVDGDGVPGLDDCDDLDVGVGEFGAHQCPYPWQQGIQSCADALTFWGVSAGDDDDSAAGSAEALIAASGVYEVKLPASSSPEPVYCDMERHGGGWTLALIASDDGQDTWTWADSQLLTNIPAPIGTLSAQPLDFASATDFKAPAYHALNFSDLLFVHHSVYSGTSGLSTPFETWAAYDGVGDSSETLPAFMLGQLSPSCLAIWEQPLYVPSSAVAVAYPLTAGTLTRTGDLCDTNLYFHLGGHSAYLGRMCHTAPWPQSPHSYGPSWSARLGPDLLYGNCGSGPGWSSLGLGANYWVNQAGWVDPVDESLVELPGLGFGLALGLNVAESGTGMNHLRMYIR